MKIVISIICIIIPAMYFGIMGKPTEMGLAIIMGGIASCFINLDRFKSFKGAGFEAQLKEAQETIDRALVTVEKLKTIVEPLVMNTLNTITHMGRWGAGGKTTDKDKIRDSCRLIISELGIKNEMIDSAIEQYDIYSMWDAFSIIENRVRYLKCFSEEATEKIINELSVSNKYQDDQFPKKELIEGVFINNGFKMEGIPDEIKNAIENYYYRLKNNTSLINDYDD